MPKFWAETAWLKNTAHKKQISSDDFALII